MARDFGPSGSFLAWPAVFCALIYLATRTCAPAAADEAQRKRFLAEAPKAWAALEEYISHSHSVVRATTTIRTRDANDGSVSEQVMHTTTELKLAGERLRSISRNEPDYPDPGPRETAVGRNRDYDFRLTRELDDGPWVIKRFHLASTPSADDPNAHTPSHGTGLYDVHFRDAVREPAFELRDAKAVADAAGERVEIDFRYKPTGDNRSRLRGGTAVFAPDLYWTLVKATALIAYRDRETPSNYTFQYKIDPAGFPLLARVEVDFDRESNSHQTMVNEYVTFEHVDIPDKEFRLSAFGLPEPPNSALPRSGWRWGWLAAGVVALLATLALARLARRKEARGAIDA